MVRHGKSYVVIDPPEGLSKFGNILGMQVFSWATRLSHAGFQLVVWDGKGLEHSALTGTLVGRPEDRVEGCYASDNETLFMDAEWVLTAWSLDGIAEPFQGLPCRTFNLADEREVKAFGEYLTALEEWAGV